MMEAKIASFLTLLIPGGSLPVEITEAQPPGIDGGTYELTERGFPTGLGPAQVIAIGPWAGVCLIAPAAEVTELLVVELRESGERDVSDDFRFSDEDDTYLRLHQGDAPVLTYNYGMILPEGVPEDRRRSSYIHPIYGLDGEVVTGDFPEDHYHHRGLFWTWPKVVVDGKTHDQWAIGAVKTRFIRWLGQEAGPVCAVFGVENGWFLGEECIVKEQVWFRVWKAGKVGRAIDAHLTFTAQEGPVGLRGADGKGYGGFGLRVPVVPGKTVTKPDGSTVASSNEEKLPWADISAQLGDEGQISGASIFIDADNPGFPNGWCLREYGYLGVHWPGLETFTLQPGEPISMSYRVWVHRGDVRKGKSAEAYRAYTTPPTVTVSEPE